MKKRTISRILEDLEIVINIAAIILFLEGVAGKENALSISSELFVIGDLLHKHREKIEEKLINVFSQIKKKYKKYKKEIKDMLMRTEEFFIRIGDFLEDALSKITRKIKNIKKKKALTRNSIKIKIML